MILCNVIIYLMMESYKKKCCRLCLINIHDKNFVLLHETIREILDVLLIKLKLDKGTKYVICKVCAKKLFAAFDFKTICLYTEDTIFPYVNCGKVLPVDLNEIYVKENGNSELTQMPGDKRICRLCMKLICDKFTSLHEVKYNMILKFIPEVNGNSIKEPVICQPCLDSLITHYNFVKDCLNVDEKIANNVCLEEITVKEEEIKDDGIIEQHNQSPHSSQSTNDSNQTEEVTKKKDNLHIQDDLQVTKCKICDYKTHDKDSHKRHIDQTHKDPSNRDMYKCNVCDHTTKYYANLKSHLLIHKDSSQINWFACDQCSYKSKYNRHLKRHLLIHKDVTQMEIFKCDKCLYRGKRLDHLKQHMLKHVNVKERKLYQCALCNIKVLSKSSLRCHMVVHSNPSETKMYKCETCDYQSKWKKAVILHAVKHKDFSEVPTYKCYLCKFETKRKGDLIAHFLTHEKEAL